MARLIDADALKICLQDHYDVIEQDCSISEEFADGAISGIDAAMFEIDAAPTVPAIPVEWLRKYTAVGATPRGDRLTEGNERLTIHRILNDWQKEQEAR